MPLRLLVVVLLASLVQATLPAQAADGLLGHYYDNQALEGDPAVTRVDGQVDFAWGGASPAPGVTAQRFSVRWVGYVQAPGDGRYELVVQADGGVRVWLDNTLVIDRWKGQGQTTLTAAARTYTADCWYPVIVEYFADGTGAEAKLLWQRPASDRATITSDDWDQGAGVQGAYFSNRDLSGTPTLVRTDPAIDFNWRGAAPDAVLPTDDFSVRWQGVLTPSETDDYRLIARTDDGVRVFVDGALVIDYWKHRSAADSFSPPLSLVAGGSYEVVMEFYERAGQAFARLDWDRAPDERHVIPADQLRPQSVLAAASSATSPACIEGIAIDGDIELVVGGETAPIHELGERGWFANVALLPDTSQVVVVSEGEYESELAIEWAATALDGGPEVVIRRDDALRFTLPPGSLVSILTESGVASGPTPVSASGQLTCSFPNAGYFTVSAQASEGGALGVREVVVVATRLESKRLVSEVGHQRPYDIQVVPQSRYLTWQGSGPLVVTTDDGDVYDDQVQISTTVTKRGSPVVLGRLAGSRCIAFAGEIDEFTFDGQGPNRGILMADDPVAQRELVMRPYLPDVWFKFSMFAGKATFPGGVRSATINTSGLEAIPENLPQDLLPGSFRQEWDPETEELVGRFDYAVELIEDNKACHRIQAGVANSPWVKISDNDTNNPKYCRIRSFPSLILPHEEIKKESGTEDWRGRVLSIRATEKDDTGCTYRVTAAWDEYMFAPPVPCDKQCGIVTVLHTVNEPGRYDKTITGVSCSGEGKSGWYTIARLDAHGTDSGTSDPLKAHVGAMRRREGTAHQPVIIVHSGGEGGSSFYGVECKGSNTWVFEAKYDDPPAEMDRVKPTYRHAWQFNGTGDRDDVEVETDAKNPKKITVTFPPGRWYPGLVVYRTTRQYESGLRLEEVERRHAFAEIRSIVVEHKPSDNVARKPRDVDAPFGTTFDLSNTNGQGERVDARLSATGAARIRVSLDGYPQNEYWGGAGDGVDYSQALRVEDGATETLYLQGYESHSTALDDVDLIVEGQQYTELCDPNDCGDEWHGEDVDVAWVVTDEEPTSVYAIEVTDAKQLARSGSSQRSQFGSQPPLMGVTTDGLVSVDGALATVTLHGPAPAVTHGQWKEGFQALPVAGANTGTAAQEDGRVFAGTGATTTYAPPIDMELSSDGQRKVRRPLTLAVQPTDPNSAGPAMYAFELVRPRVIGVHGYGGHPSQMRSTPDGGSDGLPFPFIREVGTDCWLDHRGLSLQPISYSSDNDKRLGTTIDTRIDFQIRLYGLIQMRNAQIAAQKVDFLCHSYGGLVTRWYLEQWLPANGSTDKNLGRKIITMGTPHRGTGLANVYGDGAEGQYVDYFAEGNLLAGGAAADKWNIIIANAVNALGLFLPYTPGANDMAVQSMAHGSSDLVTLNGVPFLADAAYGSVTGTDPAFLTLNFFNMITPRQDSDQSDGNASAADIDRPLDAVVPWLFVLEEPENDMFVPTYSARLPAMNTDIHLTHGELIVRNASLDDAIDYLNDEALPKGTQHRGPFIASYQNLEHLESRNNIWRMRVGPNHYVYDWAYQLQSETPGKNTKMATLHTQGMRYTDSDVRLYNLDKGSYLPNGVQTTVTVATGFSGASGPQASKILSPYQATTKLLWGQVKDDTPRIQARLTNMSDMDVSGTEGNRVHAVRSSIAK